MEQRTLIEKILFVFAFIVIIILGVVFFTNKKSVDNAIEKVEEITSLNMNTYDIDLYIYKLENNKLLTSKYFYNKMYLKNNNVVYDEYDLNKNVKFYLKTLTNTKNDINNIKVSVDLINEEEFKYILENYNLLKVYIWLDKEDNCQSVMLYSPNNIDIELVND